MGGRDNRQPGPRRSKEEIRSLLMAAGRALLDEDGLGVVAGDLPFKRALDRVASDTGVRLTNASVIRRVWENQADYRTDVLAAIVREAIEAHRDPEVHRQALTREEAERRAIRERLNGRPEPGPRTE